MPDGLGIREIGNRLSIPPSTIVYYRDRFRDHIPTVGSRGRHPRYAIESLAVFQRIRERFQEGWNADAISEELTTLRGHMSSARHHVKSGMVSASVGRQLSRMADALEQMVDGAMDNGNSLQAIDRLRDEFRQWCDDRDARLGLLESRMGALGTGGDATGATSVLAALVSLPLAVAIPPDRYVGIRDAMDQSVTLDRFMALIEANAHGRRSVDYQWSGQRARWQLAVTLEYRSSVSARRITADVESRITPRRNRVALIHHMSIDDRSLGRNDILEMLKWIKRALAQWENETG